jgi:hypothetical protein
MLCGIWLSVTLVDTHTHILLTAESEQTERLAVWAGSNYSDQTALFLTVVGCSTE